MQIGVVEIGKKDIFERYADILSFFFYKIFSYETVRRRSAMAFLHGCVTRYVILQPV